ncbi:MAG: CinA family protein [Halobacteriaceae archaeon]
MTGYAADPTDSVAAEVGAALRDAGETVAVVESETGGLVASKLTDVPGASDYFVRGYVAYTYDAKREVLGVSREALDAHGAVSAPVARQLAQRARDLADADWGLASTGVAGPTGGSEAKPVGTVFVGLARAADWGTGDSHTTVERHVFDGDRHAVKAKSATRALRRLRDALR